MLGLPSPLRRELPSLGIPLLIYMSFTAVIRAVTQFTGTLRDEPHNGCRGNYKHP